MSDEQVVFTCPKCHVPILTFWAPNGGGLLRGEYFLVGDLIFHPKCFDEVYAEIDIPEASEDFFRKAKLVIP